MFFSGYIALAPCLSEDSRSSKRNVFFMFNVSSRNPPKPFKLILLGMLMHHATDTYPPSLQKKRGFFDVPRPYEEQMLFDKKYMCHVPQW